MVFRGGGSPGDRNAVAAPGRSVSDLKGPRGVSRRVRGGVTRREDCSRDERPLPRGEIRLLPCVP
jgi:hypothetical protein